MTVRCPIVKVKLTDEQKRLVPDWEDQVADFQRRCDEMDMRDRFRLCLHEGSHAVQYGQFGWGAKFHGPYVKYKDGRLWFVDGAVSPRLNDYDPLPWQHAMVFIAGFKLVEHFTGVPDADSIIQNDLSSLRSNLSEDDDSNEAVARAEAMLEDQLSQPGFVDELRKMVRGYEFIVYNSDEATKWGWNEYHPELPGQRHSVRLVSNARGVLITNGEQLRLFSNGNEVIPSDGVRLQGITDKRCTSDAIRRWNKTVSRCGVSHRVAPANEPENLAVAAQTTAG